MVVSEDRVRYPLNPWGPPLTAGELAPFPSAPRMLAQLDALGLERAVLVQRGRAYGFDNSYVCDMAVAHPGRFRAVCSIDARDPRCGEQVAYWTRTRGGSGIRLMEPSKGAELSWLGGDTARHAWRVASDFAVPVAVHFFPWNRLAGLMLLESVLQEFPRVTVILDGVSGLAVEAGPPDFGVDDPLKRVAAFERVCAKLTNITLARLDAARGTSGQLVRRLMDLFGAERMMWGSDLVSAADTYSRAVERVRAAAEALTYPDLRCLLHATAARVYPFSGA